ncbi:MAG: ABC transporter permease [Chloroflexota bacterium]
MNDALINTLNSIIASATPLIIASLGETITERAGVINLSLNGSILLSAMAGFAVATVTSSLWLGILIAMLIGAVIAFLVAFGSLTLKQDQVAIGFVLTLLTADLAQFLGTDFQNIEGPVAREITIPLLSDIPILGGIFFEHDAFVYFSFVLLAVVWIFMFRSRAGLSLRAVGERPEAAFSRGVNVTTQQYLYTIIGGALVGLAGAAYSLGVKAGWQATPAMNGDGWIALAIVIFGGWHPARVVFGAYLFAILRSLVSIIQRDPNIDIPVVLLNNLPWILMIVTLALVSGGVIDRLLQMLPLHWQRRLRGILRSNPPEALGQVFNNQK